MADFYFLRGEKGPHFGPGGRWSNRNSDFRPGPVDATDSIKRLSLRTGPRAPRGYPISTLSPFPYRQFQPNERPPFHDPGGLSTFRVYARGLSAWELSLSCALRMASASARSCGRPAASFEAIRSSAEMKFAFNPVALSTTISTRRSHAASKSTPGMAGRISKPFGSRPKRK